MAARSTPRASSAAVLLFVSLFPHRRCVLRPEPSILARLRICAALVALAAPVAPLASQSPLPILKVGATSITINGRVQTLFNTTSVSDEPPDEWRMRRVRMEMRVVVNDIVSGKIAPDFAGNRIVLKDAYVSLRAADGVEFLAGHAHRPFSPMTQYSSLRMGPIEKGLDIRGVDGWDEQNLMSDLGYSNRDIGIQALIAPPHAPAGLSGALGLFQGPLGAGVVGHRTLQTVAQVAIAPLDDLAFTAAWSRRHWVAPVLDALEEIESGQAFLGSVAWDPAAGLFALAEVTSGDFNPMQDARFDAAHLWTGYRVPLAGRVTLVEPVARISHTRISNSDAPDGDLLTAGVNVYFGPLSRIMLNHESWRSQTAGAGNEGSWKVMFQLGF